ncbi:FadR/GntR family transcriptional regulator [Microbacterium sp. DT81.1]|uniref:FadR/GntR family transcriptional regulator n=1 Tax=Microbacterium sp. DT81.1 TaxID=3393413 RepID=UPI003CEBD8F6
MKRYPDRGLHGRVVDEFGSRIIGGELKVGEILDPEQIAANYEVSRTVVREAIKVLAGKGLIGARPGHGTFVRDRESWNLLDPDVLRWQFSRVTDAAMLQKLEEVRAMVEPSAAELAARRRTPEDLRNLFEALDAMGAPGADIAVHDERFHVGLLAATHNELIEQLSLLIGIGLTARDQFVHSTSISIERSLQMHRDVAEAVQASDPERARRAMLTLLAAAALDVQEAVDSTAH